MSKILINQYRRDLETRKRYGGSHNEGSIRYAFATLLNGYCKPRDFALVEELTIPSRINTNIRLDGIVKDALRLDWGYWEAKDEKDSLDAEIEEKFKKGYPTDNILFEDTKEAVLIQNGTESLRIDMENDDDLDKLINQFLDYERAEVKDFRTAIASFSQDLPTIIDTLRKLIDSQSGDVTPPAPLSKVGVRGELEVSLRKGDVEGFKVNNKFIEARDKFLKVCQESINPEINLADIREMIIQHILTEDIFNSIFNDAQFHQENNIASQLNEVIKTFFTRDIKKNTFKTIQSYYTAIIRTASNIVNHHEKQKFLKVVYENFYKIYNPKGADRLGIVYTPNEIVKFMVESTDYLLDKHFNKSLGSKGVEILDPCTGTGTFITEILDFLLTKDISYKYENEIHCNEVSILPYYIANLNIEYTYQQRTGQYLEFKNICLMHTLDSTIFSGKQFDLFTMSQENTERIKRQNERKISVIIGNPPYNANQKNENDNNKNREYPAIDKRIKETYVKESTAQKTKLYDMYSRFYRWATDRLNDEGIIAFITNSSFINARTFDGFRKCLAEDFDYIYILDLGGDIRSGDNSGSVFNITLGVAICFLIKNKDKNKSNNSQARIFYANLFKPDKIDDKLKFLGSSNFEKIDFNTINSDKNYNWIDLTDNDFDELIPVANKETKQAKNQNDEKAIFKLFSLGISTNRDEWIIDKNVNVLQEKMTYFIEIYNNQKSDEEFDIKIKWSESLKKRSKKNYKETFNKNNIKPILYRIFSKFNIYYSPVFIDREGSKKEIFTEEKTFTNKVIIISYGKRANFEVLATNNIFSLDIFLPNGTQSLPLYRYEKGERIENITDWGLEKFREYYSKNVEQASSLSNQQNNHRQDACVTDAHRYEKGERIENITDWGLEKFREYYSKNVGQASSLSNQQNSYRQDDYITDKQHNNHRQDACATDACATDASITDEKIISKEAIFYYIYGVLHNPKYREKYELNLKREFPRIPFYDDFWQWANWGKQLMELHLNYETIKPYELKRIDKPPLAPPLKGGESAKIEQKAHLIKGGWGVKPKLKADKTKGTIIVDEVTILENIPAIAFEYKLGNRSAIEWILDQYKEKKPKDKTIAEKFNNYQFADYKEQVIDLLMRVTTVSVETMNIINQMNN